MYRHIKLAIVGVVTLFTIGLALLDQTHPTADAPPAAAPVGKTFSSPAPDVTFTLQNGKSLPLKSLLGHTVWLHFWASWCVPCRNEFPGLLEKLQKEDANTVLLAVSGDSNTLDAERFLIPLQAAFRPLFDSGRVVLANDPGHKLIEGQFQTFQFPETIVLDDHLIMRRKIIGVFK